MRRLNPAAYEWAYIWIAVAIVVTVFQVLALLMPGTVYWWSYDSSTDVFEIALSGALVCKVSYREVTQKSLSMGLFVWLILCQIFNAINDFGILDFSIHIIFYIFAFIFCLICFCLRYLFRFHPNRDLLETGKFFEIRGRPESLQQAAVAAYTGQAGSFGITDGTDLWHYSKPDGVLIRETLKPWYANNKMCIEICSVFPDGYVILEKITGHQFTPMQNCLELRALARSWRKNNE